MIVVFLQSATLAAAQVCDVSTLAKYARVDLYKHKPWNINVNMQQ